MISRAKAKYYNERLANIQVRLLQRLDEAYPRTETSYGDLIASGAGRLRSEEEIRQACGKASRHSCPPMVEMLDIFDVKAERKAAEAAANARDDFRHDTKDVIVFAFIRARDLLQFGTDEQLLAKLEELEAMATEDPRDWQ